MDPVAPLRHGPVRESVWDYPRPPRLERVDVALRIEFRGSRIVDAPGGFRVLETSHPPTYYVSPDTIRTGVLVPAKGGSLCEWKGRARYFDIVVDGHRVERGAWSYPDPTPAFAAIRDHVSFYAGPMDRCFVGDQLVEPQPGGFYGGWITPGISTLR